MVDLQSIFDRLQDLKKQQRELKRDYRDNLTGSQEYQEIVEKMQELREKKKRIEEGYKKDFPQLERLKNDIESDVLMLSDLALNHLAKGEAIQISDEYKNQYEPIFNVRFKKIT